MVAMDSDHILLFGGYPFNNELVSIYVETKDCTITETWIPERDGHIMERHTNKIIISGRDGKSEELNDIHCIEYYSNAKFLLYLMILGEVEIEFH